MKIKRDVYEKILSSYITTVPEQGGILGEKDGCIVAYYHDSKAPICPYHAEYTPNVVNLNAKIREWATSGISFAGMIHSHPEGEHILSDLDMVYINKIFAENDIGKILYFPVISTSKIMTPYSVQKSKDGLSVNFETIDFK